MTTSTDRATSVVDAVIIGAGFSGLYMLHKLRDELGLRARVFETGNGVGGTWYWNRYPGARSDSDSYIYGYTFDKDLWESWEWTERYPESPEIRGYLEHVAERFDLTMDITFGTRVESATFDEDAERWTVTTDSGETVTADYVISAVGALSASNTPPFDGIDTFAGPTFHTGHWPHEGVDFTGQRVGMIGSGASAVQATPIIAGQASELTVFQRTANYIVPANNGPVDPAVKAERLKDWAGIRERIQQSNFGFELYLQEKGAAEVSDAEREALLEDFWNRGGFHIWLGGYADMFFTTEANDLVRRFLDRKIREKVDDPETAELLVPKGYPFGCKRNPLDSGYFETFNEPHVHLVDVKSNPIASITPTGLRLEDGTEHEFDALVLATGFDAMTGPLNRIDIRGRGGALLREKWAEGPRTYLGLMSHGYPNLFTVTGPQSPSVLSNMPVSIEQHVDYIGRIITDLRSRGARVIEPTEEAENGWCDYNQEIAHATLFPTADTWYMGANIPGKPRTFMPNLDFVGPYRAKCDQIAANGWEGFAVDGEATPAGEHVYQWAVAG
ncbi:NAD(P)/FAD-dependent oxidoreductase [Actinomycetospora endophytica]|uniref:NAD(P)/FAD-dependent oxidoreductase n=1 Tax=Actinomycetospora endophytica TaxID=2291215 RepID=A0ABS8PKM7_9PSEU|nr:NAD(P)/FAD-dependent oxidoreductase [Actinomycetospora endophytica]MCD2197529.1 NAD(P)/FAD-dependent oxidoreductase [Actinomycetospora endophytica]